VQQRCHAAELALNCTDIAVHPMIMDGECDGCSVVLPAVEQRPRQHEWA
jgi:hypothetical protein